MTGATRRFPGGVRSEALDAGMRLLRVYWTARPAVEFSIGRDNRFDAPSGEFGILYTAADLEGAFVETVLRRNGRLIRRGTVEDRSWREIVLQRPMTVAKLYGEGLLWHGTDASISTAADYGEARRLSLALYEDFDDLDGIAYRSRHDNDRLCYAFFDRAGVASFVPGAGAPFGDDWPATLALMARYGAILDPTKPL